MIIPLALLKNLFLSISERTRIVGNFYSDFQSTHSIIVIHIWIPSIWIRYNIICPNADYLALMSIIVQLLNKNSFNYFLTGENIILLQCRHCSSGNIYGNGRSDRFVFQETFLFWHFHFLKFFSLCFTFFFYLVEVKDHYLS